MPEAGGSSTHRLPQQVPSEAIKKLYVSVNKVNIRQNFIITFALKDALDALGWRAAVVEEDFSMEFRT
jgi:hypothetical protein